MESRASLHGCIAGAVSVPQSWPRAGFSGGQVRIWNRFLPQLGESILASIPISCFNSAKFFSFEAFVLQAIHY